MEVGDPAMMTDEAESYRGKIECYTEEEKG